jgi:putative protease
LEHIDKLVEAGIDSLKIEGRAKSVYYVAVVVRAYRKVLDALNKKSPKAKIKKIMLEQKKELNKLANRGYTTGFLLGGEPEHNVKNDKFGATVKFVGEVKGEKNGLSIVRLHNEIFSGDKLEAIDPEKNSSLKLKKIYNYKMEEKKEAHGGHERRHFFDLDRKLMKGTLLRKCLTK